eukprot:gnl/TRDRNA2_/TRDRNA2_86716_c1_seq1.p1 gnl/TRDRNA2_/TRDRNA2_86716_c1~~gnl/TRDRNA2_/TRDRNA2_86716_c1_seq1.p1  ORF type:complete len:320 (+),score=35.34 gnl/TRDRNA2_/TRDRNA2_86716_c1_seq1:73-960(+)
MEEEVPPNPDESYDQLALADSGPNQESSSSGKKPSSGQSGRGGGGLAAPAGLQPGSTVMSSSGNYSAYSATNASRGTSSEGQRRLQQDVSEQQEDQFDDVGSDLYDNPDAEADFPEEDYQYEDRSLRARGGVPTAADRNRGPQQEDYEDSEVAYSEGGRSALSDYVPSDDANSVLAQGNRSSTLPRVQSSGIQQGVGLGVQVPPGGVGMAAPNGYASLSGPPPPTRERDAFTRPGGPGQFDTFQDAQSQLRSLLKRHRAPGGPNGAGQSAAMMQQYQRNGLAPPSRSRTSDETTI